QKLLELLRQQPVVHADETGWRINGKNVWAWCFANPRLAVFLIDEHRSADVLKKALGESLPGVLVSDFYAAYNGLICKKQRCLAHLRRGNVARVERNVTTPLCHLPHPPMAEVDSRRVGPGQKA